MRIAIMIVFYFHAFCTVCDVHVLCIDRSLLSGVYDPLSTAGKIISRGSTRAKPELLPRLPREIIFPKVDNGSYTPLRSGLSI